MVIRSCLFRAMPFMAIIGSLVTGFAVAALVHAFWMHRLWSIMQFGSVSAPDCDSWYFDRLAVLRDGEFGTVDMLSDPSLSAMVGRADLIVNAVANGLLVVGSAPAICLVGTAASLLGYVAVVAYFCWTAVAGVRVSMKELLSAQTPPSSISIAALLAAIVGLTSWHISAHFEVTPTPLIIVNAKLQGLLVVAGGSLLLGGWCARAACLTAAIAGTLGSSQMKLCHRCYYPSPLARARCPECGEACAIRGRRVPRSIRLEGTTALVTVVILIAGAFATPRSIIGRDAWSWLRLRSTTYQVDLSLLNLPYGVPTLLTFGTEEIVVTPVFIRAANDSTPLQDTDIETLFVCSADDGRPLALLSVNTSASFPLKSGSVMLHGIYQRSSSEGRLRLVSFRISRPPDELRRADLDADLRPLWERSWLSLDSHLKANDLRLLVSLRGIHHVYQLPR